MTEYKGKVVILLLLGNLTIEPTAALAPMAGVCDRAFRELCVSCGAAYTVGEMASAKGLCLHSSKTAELLAVSPQERPMAVQLFGEDPIAMREAAKIALTFHPDAIDINMGCPAPKVANNGAGSALLKDPALAGEIVNAVCSVSSVPVTVKLRKGWDDEHISAVEVAVLAAYNGAAAITVHGRTRTQMYAGKVDLDIIRQVKQAVSVPVIGNGDITCFSDAKRMYEITGCDLVMVGRGALGNPWIFTQIKKGQDLPAPSLPERMDMMLRHISMICRYKGERGGMREARKHAAWYLSGIKSAAALRAMCGSLTTYADAVALADTALRCNPL